jgi:hypothetical protein
MGVKRWLLVLSILAVVVGLIAVLFLETGADQQIIDSVIPSVEKRLGVRITYEDVEVSLTSVSFEGVEVLPVDGERPFVRVERLGFGVRVGPLLLGELDLTDVRLDDLELRLGAEANGPGAHQWRELIDRALDPRSGGIGKLLSGAEDGPAGHPEIHLVSGRAELGDGRFALTLEGLSGRVSEGGGAVIDSDSFELTHQGRRVAAGDIGEIRYQPEARKASLSLQRPEFELPGRVEQMLRLVRDGRDSLAAAGFEIAPSLIDLPDGGLEADAGVDGGSSDEPDTPDQERPPMIYRLAVSEAAGSFVDPEDPDRVVAIDGVTGEVQGGRDQSLSIRASGGLPGTDARWVMAATWPEEGNPAITLEVPDIQLGTVGELLFGSDHLDWSRASADGVVTLELLRGGREASVRGQGVISGLTLKHRRLAREPLGGLTAHADFKLTYDRSAGVVHLERLLISRGRARVTLRGDVMLDRLAFDLRANMPPTACRHVLGAFPPELRADIEGVQLDGTIGLDLHLAIDVDDPEATVLEVALDNRCRITDFGTLRSPDEFRRPFAYTAYSADGDPLRLISGPGTDRWAPLSAISPYVLDTVLTTEDGKFRGHAGVTVPEVRRAIELNLKRRDLRHGASTITMQLAKNLFLSRERTVARKLQELFFTWYLETLLSKDEILELYLNVIEFGPSLYGVREASEHYFGRPPHELNLIESVYLVKLLPSPVTRHGSYVRGEISERKLGSLHKVMRTMRARGRITEAELLEGLKQEIAFHQAGDPAPTPRAPIEHEGAQFVPVEDEYGESTQGEPGAEWSDGF